MERYGSEVQIGPGPGPNYGTACPVVPRARHLQKNARPMLPARWSRSLWVAPRRRNPGLLGSHPAPGVGPGRTDELLDIGFVSGDSAGRSVGRGHTRHGVRQTPFREMSLQTRSGSVAARGARRRPLGNETADCHSKHRADRSPQRTLIKKITRFTKNIKFRNEHK